MASSSHFSIRNLRWNGLIRGLSSLWPLLLYWGLGGAIALLYLHPPALQSYVIQSAAHMTWIVLGVIVTAITNWVYARVSEFGERSLEYSTLVIFPLFNGLFETVWFLAAFKLGASLMALYSVSPVWLFAAGFTALFIYSGIIHAFFWLKLLPPHLNRNPNLYFLKRVWMLGLLLLTLAWAWIYFAFQDFWTVVGLHIWVDLAMVLSIRYSLWDKESKESAASTV